MMQIECATNKNLTALVPVLIWLMRVFAMWERFITALMFVYPPQAMRANQ